MALRAWKSNYFGLSRWTEEIPASIRDSIPPEGITPEHHQAKLNKLGRKWANISPMLHMGTAKDIAYAALYLASDMGAFVNCQDLVVDGGTTAAGRTGFSEG